MQKLALLFSSKQLLEQDKRWILLLNICITIFLLSALPATAQQSRFPQENLLKRIQRIEQLKQVKVAFEEDMVKAFTSPSLDPAGKNTDELIIQSLHSSELSYIKYNDTRYAIVQKKKEASVSQSTSQGKKDTGKGSLSGTVLDEKGQPVIGATVVVKGTTTGTATDVDGKYTLPYIPAGTTTIQISFMSYETLQVNDVKIVAGKITPLDVVLKEATQQLGEVVITAAYGQASANGLYAKQKNMVAMSDGVSSDMIKKTSDNNVAQVLKRVSGVTIDNGKYVIVRGLGERYNNVQLNGSSLPSTEPNRRNFSFDIIPTALIDNVTISKTFTPDLPGEFTGGLVEVNTLSVPQEPLISVSLGTGFNTISTGKEFRSNKRFDSDYLFGNSRDWYDKEWKSDISNGIFIQEGKRIGYDQLTDDQRKTLNQMDARVPNYWGLRNFKGAPTQSYAITAGLPFDLGNNNKLGMIASLTYRHEENTEDLQRATYMGSAIDTLITGKRYKFITTTGAVANIGWERPGHKITWRNLFNNRFTHTNMERVIWKQSDILAHQMEQFSSVQINRLWQTQLSGEHQLPKGLLFSWMADYCEMLRTTPDDRLATGAIMSDPRPVDGNYLINWLYPYGYNFAGFQMYSRLKEEKKNIGGNLEYPFVVEGNKQKLKVGYLGTFRNADFNREYLQTVKTTDVGRNPYEDGLSLEETYAPELYAEGKLYLRNIMGSLKDYYKGDQQVHAAYLMGDFTFRKKLHVTAGVRMEAGNMEAQSMYRDNARQMDVDTTLVNKKTDWLPALTLIYNITDNFNVRGAYSKTIARPDFRELAISTYYNVEDRIEVRNVAGIKQTYIDNADLRFEWYLQAGEVISISGFYKRFKNPVELLTVQSQQDLSYSRYTFNLQRATTLGLELNLRKSFGFVSPGSFLKDIYLTANATILKGDVKYNTSKLMYEAIGLEPPKDVEFAEDRNRPLQGLVPYAVNAGLDYSGKIFGAAISYGTTGRKLVLSGEEEKDDEYEAPRNVLDLQLSVRPLKNLEIKANASDILNETFVVYRNTSSSDINVGQTDDMSYNKGKDLVMGQYKKGVTCSFSVNYKF
ncbi:TonB-dependent receptor domain-containing protein [Dysgonomonas sp. BGC7]|uniref:TonB-dependent receptor domain-containing protein n=1 Tax=Dysgonomonas sp. BGC7 TaxID=1658008 RepID=UPI0009E2728F|nr:TonB-dependent receptor [Dysgonomonas sp. BGC7]MBD8387775.1 TonB-dependent receptor [Dysgonomonas sp. BGC7]